MDVPSVFYHSRTKTLVTGRQLLGDERIADLRRLLPENERYQIKYVTVCLESGPAGQVDRDCLLSILEMFGQMRDTGVNPMDILREARARTEKLAPAVKARRVEELTDDELAGEAVVRRSKRGAKA